MAYWTDASIVRLRALVGEGWTAARIAKVLSDEFGAVSRNAVVGKIARMKDFPQLTPRPAAGSKVPKGPAAKSAARAPLSRRTGRATGLARPSASPRVGRSLAPQARLSRAPAARPRPDCVTEDPAAYDAASRHLALVDLDRGDCRFPVTDDPGGRHLFCALPAVEGSYCAHHRLRCGGGAFSASRAASSPSGDWPSGGAPVGAFAARSIRRGA